VRFILRRFVIGIAGFIGLLVYQSLRPLPIAIDVALAVGFTIEVIGLVMTSRLFASEPAKPLPSVGKMALTHLGFLAGVVVIERIFPLLQMLVPGGYTTLSGRPGSWALLIEVVAITLLGYAERKMLLGGPKTVKAAVWADTAIGAGWAAGERSPDDTDGRHFSDGWNSFAGAGIECSIGWLPIGEWIVCKFATGDTGRAAGGDSCGSNGGYDSAGCRVFDGRAGTFCRWLCFDYGTGCCGT